PVATAELRPDVVVTGHAFRRHVGIELERTPRNRHVIAAADRQRPLEAAFADVAPRTNRVGNDVNVDHAPTLRLSRHCRKRAEAATIPSVAKVSSVQYCTRVVIAPSTMKLAPLTNEAGLPARKATQAATSCGVPMRPIGLRASVRLERSV